MSSQYEIVEKIYSLDLDAGVVSHAQRAAQKALADLSKKSALNEELLKNSRNEMAFHESELRRLYKRFDELDDKKNNRAIRMAAAKTDADHRAYKREIENIERDIRDIQRKIDDIENKIEASKAIFYKAEATLNAAIAASADELKKAKLAEDNSAGKLLEIQNVRETYLTQLDERTAKHYERVSKLTKNPNGPICRVVAAACGNCRIGLSPQTLNSVNRAKNLEFCPHCFHILLPSGSN